MAGAALLRLGLLMIERQYTEDLHECSIVKHLSRSSPIMHNYYYNLQVRGGGRWWAATYPLFMTKHFSL